MSTDTLKVSIWRGGADGDYQLFEVPARADQTVLDVVTWVQRNTDHTLAYRFACRVGMCGSCAMMVNGVPRWTCRSHVSKFAKGGALKLAPLANLPVIKDLVANMDEFFEKWQRAGARFAPSANRNDDVAPIAPDTPARVAANAAVECINCAVCYAACDTVKWNSDYLGPAALNRVWTLINDERDAGDAGRMAAVRGPGGCYNCHSHQSCQVHCPMALNPARSIAGLKRAALAVPR